MAKKYAVIGLGSFGEHLAVELTRHGAEVLAIDSDMEKLDDVKDRVAHTVRLDSTEERPMREQGLDDMDGVIVGLRDNFEAELLTVSVLQQIGVKRVIVIATSTTHERILNHLGIKEVVLPAVEAADRLATSLMFEQVLDSFAVSSDHSIAEITAPDSFIGQTVLKLDLRTRFEISLITIKRIAITTDLLGLRKRETETSIGVPTPGTTIERGDILVVFGSKDAIKKITGA